MTHLLVIAHAPLASALRDAALHVFPDAASHVLALDVQVMAPFWGDRRQWRNHVMLLFVLACTLMQIKVGLWIVDWDKRFYDSLAALQGQLISLDRKSVV